MASKREQCLSTLYTKLKILESDTIKIYRNLDKPQKVSLGGMIILRDGSSDEPEVLLSPLTYIFEHNAQLEVIVQNPDTALRDSTLDTLLATIGSLINDYRTLDGLAEWIEARSPEFQEEPIEGAASVKSASVQLMVRFNTTDPLH